jgi:ligand-binding sensor domain-containing protein/two-component sensor histidine kinase
MKLDMLPNHSPPRQILFFIFLSCIGTPLIPAAHSEPASESSEHLLEPPNFLIIDSSLSEVLRGSSILDIVTAHNGEVWVSTREGIASFDGQNVKFHPLSPSSIQNAIHDDVVALYETEDRRIVGISSRSGLIVFDPRTETFVSPEWLQESSDQLNTTEAAFQASDGMIWLGHTFGSISGIDYKSRRRFEAEHAGTEKIVDFSETANGSLLALNSIGEVYELDGRNTGYHWKRVGACSAINNAYSEIGGLNPRSLFLGTRGAGIKTLDLISGDCNSFDPDGQNSFLDLTVREIYLDPNQSSVTFATDQGLIWLDKTGTMTVFNESNSDLPSSEIYTVRRINDALYWVGTFSGPRILLRTNFDLHSASINRNLASVVAISGKNEYGAVIATYNNGIQLATDYSHKQLGTIFPAAKLKNRPIMSLYADNNDIWVGYRSSGLDHYSIDKESTVHFSTASPSPLSSNSISTILKVPGGIMLIGTYGGGVQLIDQESEVSVFQHSPLDPYSIVDNRVIFVFRDSSGNIWVGTESGVQIFDIEKSSFQTVNVIDHGNGSHVVPWTMTQSPDGRIWLGTSKHGLLVAAKSASVEDLVFRSVQFEPQDSDIEIFSLQSDLEGNIWISSHSGLYKLDTNEKLISYVHSPALRELAFDIGASGRDIDRVGEGYLYFGGSNGYVRFMPSQVSTQQQHSPMKVNNISIGGISPGPQQNLEKISEIALEISDYFFTVDYSVIDYISSKKLSYRHKLEGFDVEWRQTGNRGTATYTNLPPGKYTFHAQGTNSAGIRNEKGIKIQVLVHPPPWRTWWAYTLYGAAALFLFWLAWRWYYTYRLKEEAMTMARKMTMEAEYALDELQEQLEVQDSLLSSIHSRNVSGLELLRDISSRADHGSGSGTQSHSQRSISALASLEDALLHQQDRLYADMQRCVEDIAAKLLEQHQEEATSISVINEVSVRPVEAGTGSLMAVAIYELLDNAIVHTSKARAFGKYIKIALSISEPQGSSSRLFELSVSDNGEGGSEEIFSQTSGGAAVITLIAEHLNASLTVSSENGMVVTMVFSQPSSEL